MHPDAPYRIKTAQELKEPARILNKPFTSERGVYGLRDRKNAPMILLLREIQYGRKTKDHRVERRFHGL